MSTKFGRSVMIPGIMSAARKTENTMFRPRHWSLANAYAARSEQKTTTTVSTVA